MMKRRLFGKGGDRSASVAPTVAMALFALIGAGGIAFDYARMTSLDTEMQNAADQAALAAASQLDRESGACARAANAANALVSNQTVFANEARSRAITVFDGTTDDTLCDATGNVRFYQDKTKQTAATSDANARFVEVWVNGRRANFALTPVVSAFSSGSIRAAAYAGVGSAICKVPPLMICNPSPGSPFPVTPGLGVKVVAHQNGQSWSAGNFGFLNVGQANNGAPDLLAAMAYQNASLTCQDIDTGDVDTGATVPAITAANTRFDIYDFGGGSGSTLGACNTGSCPAALNVTKDLTHASTNFTANNACKIHNSGWELVTGAGAYAPRLKNAADTDDTFLDTNITAMGLPRDLCHYDSWVGTVDANNDGVLDNACTGGRVGDGKWGRADYFEKYHSTGKPSGWQSWTRYQTYIWEIQQNNMPNGVAGQYGRPQCSTGTLDPTRDRRVFTVAIADNCSSLSGSSTPVQISRWIDMFFVEPGVNGRGNGSTNDEIYLEVIREAQTSGDGTNAQLIRRDVPYLIE